MAAASGLVGVLWAVSSLLLEVVLFWIKVGKPRGLYPVPSTVCGHAADEGLRQQKFGSWWKSRNVLDDWLDALRNAESYEDWEHAALHLDNIKQLNLW